MIYYYLAGAILLMLVGIIGVVIPAVPGIPLMATVALIFHFFVKGLPLWALIALLIITGVSILIDQLSGILGARFAGASAKSMLLGFLGMFVAISFIPPFGAIIGLFAGILIGELVFKKNTAKAMKAASVGALSVVSGILINFLLALTFITIFIIGAVK